jgi:hypothetical protein
MKKLVQLLFLAGSLMTLQGQETLVASGTCSCTFEANYYHYLITPPHCGYGHSSFPFAAGDATGCANLCNYYALQTTYDACGSYSCDEFNNPPSYGSMSGSWSFDGGGSGSFGPTYVDCP